MIRTRVFVPLPNGEKYTRSVEMRTGFFSVSMRRAIGFELPVLPAWSVAVRRVGVHAVGKHPAVIAPAVPLELVVRPAAPHERLHVLAGRCP